MLWCPFERASGRSGVDGCQSACVSDPELLVYQPLDDAIVDAARAACLEAVRTGCAERGVAVPTWARLDELSRATIDEAGGERWLRYAAGDTTRWYVLIGPIDENDIVMTAVDFGTMLANDVLPLES